MAGIFARPPGWETFYRVLAISAAVHVVALAVALFLHMPATKRMFFAPVYNVTLVDPSAVKGTPPARKKAAPKPVEKAAPKPAEKAAPKPAEKAAPKPAPAEKSVKIKAADKVAPPPKETPSIEGALEKIRASVQKEEQDRLVAERIKRLKEEEAADKRRVEESLAALRAELAEKAAADTAEEPQRPGAAPVAAGRISMENLKAEHPEYYRTIHDRVWENWVYPVDVPTSEMSIIVSIKIARSGKLLDRTLELSSGNEFFDQSLLNAITKAAPFPPLPEEIVGEYLETGLRFCPGCTE